jgi:hypothetical protein
MPSLDLFSRRRFYPASFIVLAMLLSALVAALLLTPPLLVENAYEARAAATDSAPGQCEEDYALCRRGCRDASCLASCEQDYNSCRRRGGLDR